MTRTGLVASSKARKWAACAVCALALAGNRISGQGLGLKPDAAGFVVAEPDQLQPSDPNTQIVLAGDPNRAGST